jgi:CRP-like cAMP-binding protein
VRAVTVCDLYSLSVDDFHAVLRDFPDIRQIMETVAKERLTMIQAMLSSDHGSEGQNGMEGMESEHRDSTLQDSDLTTISEGDSMSDSSNLKQCDFS